MLYVLVSLIGIFIALMVAFNGALGNYLPIFEVSFIVHLIGLVLLVAIMIWKRVGLNFKDIPKKFLLTGIIGAMLTAIDAYVVGSVGVTLAVGLSILAQVFGSFVVDSIGVGQLNRVGFSAWRLVPISMLVVGILMMVIAI